ncbi:MAG TPA: FkbM family methyltransferase [Stellaceae bacterium]|nr:FkbM family methyltransferase [Stellaceae bacterium]
MSDRSAQTAADIPRLLKRLYRFRARTEAGGWARLGRRRRKAALVAALRCDWPGGYALTDSGELAFVPAPLDARGEHVLFHGFDAPAAALRFAPQGGVAVDVGANLGEWSVPLAKAVGPGGLLLCCEPNPAMAAALSATLAINNLHQATVLPIAVSSCDGEGRLAINLVDSGQSRLSGAGIAVPLRSLDSLVADHGLQRLDLLKIDVEGHEAQVLAGAGETLARLRPAVIFESGHETGDERAQIAERLEAAGYEILAVLHHYGGLPCTMADYRAAAGACAGAEARNLLALPRRLVGEG